MSRPVKAARSNAATAPSLGIRAALAALTRRLRRALAESFAVNLRSLAVFRIGLGLVVLGDACLALGNAELLYSDVGVLPRALLHERHWPAVTSWSLHALGGGVEWQAGLMVLQMLAAVGLIVGRHTRPATFLCWVLVSSLETRNPVVTNGADAMTRLLLFWSLFLPLGARWSLDARGEGRMAGPPALRSVAGAALLLQVAFVYWFSVLCKTHGCWWGDGSALIQTLQLDLFARPFALWLRGHAELCRLLTYGWLVVEIAGPLLAFLPFWRARLRTAAVLLFVSFHAGIELCMDIGAFPAVMIVAWCAFLPGAVWERLARWRRGGPRRDTAGPEFPQACVPVRGSAVALVRDAFCLACLAFVLLWNLRGTDFTWWERFFPRSVNPAAFALRLDQHWSMFAPRPTSEDGWFVLRAGMSDGTEADLLRGGAPADFRRPELGSAHFKDARWQKLLINLWLEDYRHLRGQAGDAVAQHWNHHHGGLGQVVAWQLWFMLEPTLPDGSAGPVKPCLLFERERFGSEWPPSSREPLRVSFP